MRITTAVDLKKNDRGGESKKGDGGGEFKKGDGGGESKKGDRSDESSKELQLWWILMRKTAEMGLKKGDSSS